MSENEKSVASPLKKQRGRPFPKGKSGNPAGKPQGCLSKVTRAAQELLDGQAEALTQRAVELALAGDTTALRLCLERLLPPRKDRPVEIKLPAMKTAADAVRVSAAVLAAVARGELTPTEGQSLAGLVEAHRKVLESVDIEQRLAALELAANRK